MPSTLFLEVVTPQKKCSADTFQRSGSQPDTEGSTAFFQGTRP